MSISLLRVDITDFRAIRRHLTIDFVRPNDAPSDLSVLSGPNGTGKTSILEAILLAMGHEKLILRSLAPDLSDHWRIKIPDGAKIALTFYVASAPGTELGVLAPCQVRLTRTAVEWFLEEIDGQVPRALPNALKDALLAFCRIDYYSSSRTPFQLGGVKVGATGVPDNERFRLRRLKQRIVNERAVKGFSDRETEDLRWLSEINKVWQSWHNDTTTKINAEETNDPEEPFDLFVVRQGEFGPETVCALDECSSGELEWFTLIGEMIVAGTTGIVIIDEPELHLHPEWQVRLLPTLQAVSPEVQFILATHSSYPWDQALPYQRVLLVPLEDPRHSSLGA